MVYSGIYPINTADYEHLKANLAKLQLNDAAFVYQQETSVALGSGFAAAFLGLLHLRSSKNACVGSSRWTSSRPIPAWSIRSP